MKSDEEGILDDDQHSAASAAESCCRLRSREGRIEAGRESIADTCVPPSILSISLRSASFWSLASRPEHHFSAVAAMRDCAESCETARGPKGPLATNRNRWRNRSTAQIA